MKAQGFLEGLCDRNEARLLPVNVPVLDFVFNYKMVPLDKPSKFPLPPGDDGQVAPRQIIVQAPTAVEETRRVKKDAEIARLSTPVLKRPAAVMMRRPAAAAKRRRAASSNSMPVAAAPAVTTEAAAGAVPVAAAPAVTTEAATVVTGAGPVAARALQKTFGCSKCRNGMRGCQRCRAWAVTGYNGYQTDGNEVFHYV